MSLGNNIRKRRFELNMSQSDLASLLGYKSRSSIAKIESGENSISHNKIIEFAKALDTSYSNLTFDVDVPNYETMDFDFVKGDDNRICVIILAGGKSNRNKENIPNQFIDILGKPVILYSLEAYERHPLIDDIYISCLKGWEDITLSIVKKYNITKFRGVYTGGDSGVKSIKISYDAIKNNYKNDDFLILQESTRPMINLDMISRLIQSMKINSSATICKSMRDNVQFLVNDYNCEYINRDLIVDLESPEGHSFERINNVFDKAIYNNDSFNESCLTMLMYNYGFKINFINCFINNIKIIHQEDIKIASLLLKYNDINY